MDKSTFLCGMTITIWLAFVFDLITDHTAAQIILILFIVFSLVQLGMIKEKWYAIFKRTTRDRRTG